MPIIKPISLEQLNFPQVSSQAAQVLAALSAAEPDLKEVERAVLHDPMLAGALIRYANSPLYRRGGEVSNVPTAIRLIGLKNVRSAVVMSTLRSSIPVDCAVSRIVLDHLQAIAVLCKLIAHGCCPQAANDMELMGLIHDMGMLVLTTNFADEYRQLLERSHQEGITLDELERDIFGFSHDQIAARALHEFRLPKRHENVLMHFHQAGTDSELEPDMRRERAILMLAHHLLAERLGDTGLCETLLDSFDALTVELDIDADGLDSLRAQIEEILGAEL
jgi:HD-like signal output (HDOD) protein